jgi:hypothetical protein
MFFFKTKKFNKEIKVQAGLVWMWNYNGNSESRGDMIDISGVKMLSPMRFIDSTKCGVITLRRLAKMSVIIEERHPLI